MTDTAPRPSPQRGIKDRGRVFASGALAAAAMAVAMLIVLSPLTQTRADLRQIAEDGVPRQAQLVELRTTIVDWQFFIERHLDEITPGAATDATELVKGGALIAKQTKQAATLTRDLQRVRFTSDARAIASAMLAFTTSLTVLGPVASGTAIDPAKLRVIVATERAALEALWRVTPKSDATSRTTSPALRPFKRNTVSTAPCRSSWSSRRSRCRC